MTWESTESYHQLVQMHPDLEETTHKQAFAAFVNRMWTKPETLADFARAYMEFTTSHTYTFPKLKALYPEEQQKPNKSRRSRRRRSRQRRKPKKTA
jgi:hypothetical protein